MTRQETAAEAHERMMLHTEFWDVFSPLFRDDKVVREFAEITGLSEERIRAARFAYLYKKFTGKEFNSLSAPHGFQP